MAEEIATNEKLLTFIIPVYNVEKYINECVDSILNQLTDDCEVILVDDGSPDSSGVICDGYADKDSRVRVVHQQNGGLSAARNAGLYVANGRYITFVDSDDYIGKGSIERILSWIEKTNADICFLKAWKVFPDGSCAQLDDTYNAEKLRAGKSEAIRYLSEMSKYPGSAWTKLFRADYLKRNNLHFPKDRRISEDLGFIRDCILSANSFDALPVDFYYYRQVRQGSITSKITMKSFEGLGQFVCESVEKLTCAKEPKGEIECDVLSFAAYEYSIMLWQYNYLEGNDKKTAFEFLKKYRWILQYGKAKKVKLVNFVLQILGIDGCSRVLDMYMRNR